MDDMTAFERQLSDEIRGLMGHVRPVDDLAVFDAVVAATQSPKRRFWSASRPSAHGHIFTATGRTYAMFSPVKAIIAGALVFALGGLFLVAQPFAQERGSLPGAATDATKATATAVTATQECRLGYVVDCTYTASDPRVTGTGSHVFTGSASETGSSTVNSGAVGAFWSDTRIDGPDGAWTGHHYIVTDGTGTAHTLIMLAGEGAYDGWSYIASGTDPESDGDHELVGVIYEGALPPVGPLPATASE
jgi:hypothetical protein